MTRSFRVPRLYAYFAISAVISLGIWVLLLLPNFLAGRGWSSQEIGWAVGSYFLVNLYGDIESLRLHGGLHRKI